MTPPPDFIPPQKGGIGPGGAGLPMANKSGGGVMQDLILGIRSLLLPRVCLGCKAPLNLEPAEPICPPCLQGLPRLSPPFFSGRGCLPVISPFRYEGLIRDLILAFKYQGRLSLASFLAESMAQAVTSRLGVDPADAVVPVPLHPTRLRERSFNQAQILARKLGDRLGLPLLCGLLERRKPTLPQAELSRSQRLKNMRGAFELRCPAVRGLRLLLVDDVVTTGATVDACARLLKRSGAACVTAATVARG